MARTATPDATAAALLGKLGTAIPVAIEELCVAQGVQIATNYFQGDEAGFSLRHAARLVIGVNTATSPRRQRFVIAHQLGHILLHDMPLLACYSIYLGGRDRKGLATETQEREANQFAASLLMPRDALVHELRNMGDVSSRDELIANMARTFNVSVEAMGYRLVSLNIITA